MMNRKNNKGFSLVELIVVVAIMAVLVGVLAPAYLRYVEKSRYQKDASAVAEAVEAIKVCAAEEAIYDYLVTNTANAAKVTIADGDTSDTTFKGFKFKATGGTVLEAELAKTIGTITYTSKTWKAADTALEVDIDANGGVTVTVTGTPTAP